MERLSRGAPPLFERLIQRFGWAGAAALAALAVWLLVTLPGLGSKHFYEWDSIQLAMGAWEWNIDKHQPHPMGFPIWILMLKILLPVMDPQLSQRVLSLAFTIAALLVLRRLLCEAVGETAALTAVALVAWAPPVRMMAVAQSTYTVDFFGGALAGLLAIKAWRGDARSAFSLPVLVALLAGVRSSTGTFLAPLVALALFVFLRKKRNWAAAAGGIACAAVVVTAWLIPTLHAARGWRNLMARSQDTFGLALPHSSIFHGAQWIETRSMMELSTVWIGLSLTGLLVPGAVWLLFIKMWKPCAPADSGPLQTPLNSPLFYLAWAGPTLFAIYFIHGPKPGYHLLALPALALAAAIVLRRIGLAAAGSEGEWGLKCLGAGLAAVNAVTLLPYGHLVRRHDHWYETFRAMPQIHAEIDRNTEALFRLIDERGPAAAPLIYRWTFEGPNSRSLQLYRPSLTHATIRWDPGADFTEFRVVENLGVSYRRVLPEPVREVLIITSGKDPNWSTRAEYPMMRRVFKGRTMQIWLAPYR